MLFRSLHERDDEALQRLKTTFRSEVTTALMKVLDTYRHAPRLHPFLLAGVQTVKEHKAFVHFHCLQVAQKRQQDRDGFGVTQLA